MKTKPDPMESGNAVREATLKVAKLRRIVEAEEKLARAAKVRFKGAKKTWKLARKTAKRSAKKLKRAEERLAALAKHFKVAAIKPKTKRRTRATPARPAAKKPTSRFRSKSRRVVVVPPPAIAPDLETAIVPAPNVAPPQPNGEPTPG